MDSISRIASRAVTALCVILALGIPYFLSVPPMQCVIMNSDPLVLRGRGMPKWFRWYEAPYMRVWHWSDGWPHQWMIAYEHWCASKLMGPPQLWQIPVMFLRPHLTPASLTP